MAVDTPAAELPVVARLRRQAVRGGTLLLAARLLTQLFQWSVTLFVVRLLTPDDYGMMTAGVLFVGLADLLAEAGVGKALIHKKDLVAADLAQGFTLGLILSAVLYTLLFLAAGPAAVRQDQPAFALFLRVLGLLLFLVPLRAVTGALLERDLHLAKQSAIQLGGAVAAAAFVLSLALAGMGYWALAAGTLTARLFEAACMWYASGWRPELAWPARHAWGLLRYGLHISGATLLWFVYNNSDFAALGVFGGLEVLGFYSVAFQLMTLPVQKVSAHVNHVMFAVFCKLQDDRPRIRNWFLRLTVLQTFVIMPALAGLALVAADAIPLLFKPRWAEAVLPFQLLCPVGVIMVISAALHQTLAALGRPDLTLKYNLVCACLLPAGFFSAAWLGGTLRVCLVWLVLTPLLVGGLIHCTRGVTGIGVRDVLRSQLPVLAGVACMVCCVLAIEWVLRDDERIVLRLIAAIATGVATYTAWMLLTARRTVLADVRGLWLELRGRES
jgi:O-antigen/teichoic acid export membrane protein